MQAIASSPFPVLTHLGLAKNPEMFWRLRVRDSTGRQKDASLLYTLLMCVTPETWAKEEAQDKCLDTLNPKP